MASFEHSERPGQVSQYDLYVFDQPDRQDVCLRYGSEGREYISPGELGRFVRGRSLTPLYARAVEILIDRGVIRWSSKTKGEAT